MMWFQLGIIVAIWVTGWILVLCRTLTNKRRQQLRAYSIYAGLSFLLLMCSMCTFLCY